MRGAAMVKMKHRYGLIFVLKKTAFVYGALCGVAIVVPILLTTVTSDLLPFLLLPVLLIASNYICGIWAFKELKRLNEILHTDLDPDRFLKRFLKDVYSKKPDDWNGFTVTFVAQAYHAQGRFKEEERLYLRYLNEGGKLLMPEFMSEGDYALLGSLVVLYSDTGNVDGVKKAYAAVQKLETALSQQVNDEVFKTALYNCYLKGIGRFDECVEYFEHCVEISTNKLLELQSHFRLAEIYAALGKSEAAQKEYRIVAENGKDLYIVHEAAQKLAPEQ